MTHLAYPEYPAPLKKRVDAIKDEDIAEALFKTQGLQYKAAHILGCSPGRLAARIKESPFLQEIRLDARETRIDEAEKGLFEAVDQKDLTAILFTLKTIGKNRGYSQDSQEAQVVDKLILAIDLIKNRTKDLINERTE